MSGVTREYKIRNEYDIRGSIVSIVDEISENNEYSDGKGTR